MGVLVNAAVATFLGVVASFLSSTFLGSKSGLLFGVLAGVLGFMGAGSALQGSTKDSERTSSISALEAQAERKAAKKARKQAAEKAKREAAEAAKAREEAEKKAAKKAAAKKAAKKAAAEAAAKAAQQSESSEDESESEAEEVVAAPKSKSALKKAKAKAKAAAEKAAAEAAAKAAEAAAAAGGKKKKKAKDAAKAASPDDKAAAEKAKAAAAAAAADLEGWETIEITRPNKSSSTKASNKKDPAIVPPSERLLTIDLIIPVKQHALIIGTKGATLNLLQSGSGAQIDMPKRESGSAKIQITGTPAQVQQAKNAIESLIDRGFSHLTHPGVLSDDISIEQKDIGLVLGANGKTLKTIQAATGARINLPEKGSSSKKVTIVGEKEAVKLAKSTLRQLLQDGFSPLTHEGWIKNEIEFPAEKFGILIGPKGQTIKSIQGNTKCRINLPEKNSKSNIVSVCGAPAGVAQATKEILRLLEPPAPLPDPEEEDLATDDAWGQEHTAQGEDALWE